MNSLSIRLSCLPIFLMLSACGDDDFPDLKDFVQEVKEIEGEKIEPIDAISIGDFFYYELDGSRDPFVQAMRMDEVIEDEVNIDLPKKITNGIKPNFKRIKEDLENFPLDALKMVGTVKTDQLWGLIRSEEGIQKVKVGNYMGKNHGKITQISAMGIKLEEIVKEEEASEIWIKKEVKLPLDMGVDE